MRAIIMLCLGLWAALLLNPGEVYAQRGLPGQVALGVNGGIADGFSFRDSHGAYRFWGELELTRYNRNHSYWNFAVSCLRKDYRYEGVLGDQLVPMAQFTAEAGYNHPLISDRGRNISLFAGLAGVAGYETNNWGDKHLRDGATLRSDDSIIYGGRLSASLEGYLSNRVIVLLNLREYCTFGSSTGTFHTNWGIGFRFIIN